MSVSKGKMFKLYLVNCVFIGFFSGVFYSVIDIIKFIYNDASLSVILMPVLYPFTSSIEFFILSFVSWPIYKFYIRNRSG